jgi:hypothetical protein
VVARGCSPVVDASRGRNDPRKGTVGGRAWRGLEVRPAPGNRERAEFARRGRPGEVRVPSRRVWGQRPGQPARVPSREAAMPRRSPTCR